VPQPSAHYRQHHEVTSPRVDDTAFDPPWRVQCRLDRLRRDRRITLAQWHAGVRLRRLYAIAFRGLAGNRGLSGFSGVRAGDGGIAARLDALRELRALSARLGPKLTGFLEVAIVDDGNWERLGRFLGVDPKTAKELVVVALRALAAAFRE
jgi:hypothetical protein